jgi:hypothetical protein
MHMQRIRRTMAWTLVLAGFAWAGEARATSHEAVEPGWPDQLADAVLVRPLALVGALASTGVFLGTLPLTFPMGIGDECAHVLMEGPWRFTAGRVLGDVRRYNDGRNFFGEAPPDDYGVSY